jgi:RAD3-like DEAD/DEAH box helicase
VTLRTPTLPMTETAMWGKVLARTHPDTGGNDFMDLMIPKAQITLRQGSDRLVRDHDDRGVAAVLDSRVATRGLELGIAGGFVSRYIDEHHLRDGYAIVTDDGKTELLEQTFDQVEPPAPAEILARSG